MENKCVKCGFESAEEEFFTIETNTLCSFCFSHAPKNNASALKRYIEEKIDFNLLKTFRKSENSLSKKTKQGMNSSFNKGIHISKPPKGYKISNKQLVFDEEKAEQVKRIFSEFLESTLSLNKLSKKYSLTTSGLKKLLKNPVYIGKIRLNNIELQGKHPVLIDKQVFEQVQNRLNPV